MWYGSNPAYQLRSHHGQAVEDKIGSVYKWGWIIQDFEVHIELKLDELENKTPLKVILEDDMLF